MVGGEASPLKELAAVVRFGDCSGVLVSPNQFLTAAHCVGPALASMTIAGGATLSVARCRVHPRFEPGTSAYDVAICALNEPSTVTPIRIASSIVDAGAEVILAGYGQHGPFGHAAPTLGWVTTVVAGVGPATLLVGTDDHTACVGDSGGPVLVRERGELRVTAILQGPSAALCRSPTVANPIDGNPAWSTVAEQPGATTPIGWLIAVVAAVIVGLASRRWSHRQSRAAVLRAGRPASHGS